MDAFVAQVRPLLGGEGRVVGQAAPALAEARANTARRQPACAIAGFGMAGPQLLGTAMMRVSPSPT